MAEETIKKVEKIINTALKFCCVEITVKHSSPSEGDRGEWSLSAKVWTRGQKEPKK